MIEFPAIQPEWTADRYRIKVSCDLLVCERKCEDAKKPQFESASG